MRVFLDRLRDLILSCMDDFSQDHASVSVSSCGVFCFDPGEGLRGTCGKTNPRELPKNDVRVGLQWLSKHQGAARGPARSGSAAFAAQWP